MKLTLNKIKILCERLIKIRDTKIENEINNIRITERRKKSLIQNEIAHNDIYSKGTEMLSTLCLTTLEYLNVSDNFICDLVLYFISN